MWRICPASGRCQAFPGSPPHVDGRRQRPDRSARATRHSADRSRFATSEYQGFKRCSPSPRSEGTADRSRRREPRRATRHRPDRKLALPRLLPRAAGPRLGEIDRGLESSWHAVCYGVGVDRSSRPEVGCAGRAPVDVQHNANVQASIGSVHPHFWASLDGRTDLFCVAKNDLWVIRSGTIRSRPLAQGASTPW
jgi:hypothetical protein